MISNLPANLETLSTSELMELSGQKQEGMASIVPVLRVNYDDQTDEEKPIPRGQWTYTTKDGVTVYAKECLFNPILATYQYSHYDADLGKMVSVSVHFKSWSDEVPDSAGGFKCGKVPRREFDKLPKADQEVQKKIKLSRVLFGFVSMIGVTAEGKTVEVNEEPCMFYARGTNYMPIEDFLSLLTKKGKPMQAVVAKLTLKRERNQNVTFWTVVPEIASEKPITKETIAAMREFHEGATAESEAVLEKWKKARAKGTTAGAKALVERIINVTAKDVTNEDLPFNDSLDDSPLGDDFKNPLAAG